MARNRISKLHCPTCKKPVKSQDSEFPFCSERCRLIDLGKWAGGDYRVPTNERPHEEVHRSNGNREDDE